ncbi:conserved hypothetical protein [Enhydrobacter sp. AX1]|nr:conserved hypothetical protein [Enhydrobacter sp. AX1]
MIDVKPTMIARTFESVWLFDTFKHYQVDKYYDALNFSKENDARYMIYQFFPSA